MLLCIDIGNSTTSFGVVTDGAISSLFKIPTQREPCAPDIAGIVKAKLAEHSIGGSSVKRCIISSVVPELDSLFRELIINTFKVPVLFVDSTIKLSIDIKVKEPANIGADRLANAIGAYSLVQENLIVIDIGTAATFDHITKDGIFLGGVIAPGPMTALSALYNSASKLNTVEITPQEKVIGDDTASAMQSGIWFGYIGLIDNIVNEMKREISEDVKVILTGGAAAIFKDRLDIIDIYDEHLIFKGLYNIDLQNRPV